jgi:hypothetical protein
VCFVGKRQESIDHLMVNCSFTKEVWSFVLQFLHLRKVWGIGKLSVFFQDWIKEMGALEGSSLFHLLGNMETSELYYF